MSTHTSDINLVIRARTEGEKAIGAIAEMVERLKEGASGSSAPVLELGRALGALDKAAAGLETAQSKVGSTAAKQASAIHQATAGIAEQQARIADLSRGMAILSTEADKAFIGPRRNGLTDLLRLAKTELADAERSLNRYTASFDKNVAALQTSRSGLLDLRRSTADVSSTQEVARTQITATTEALARQEQTARANGAALAAISRTQPGASGKSAAESASVFARGGLTTVEQDLAAAEALRTKLDPLAAVQNRLNAELERYRGLAAAGRISTDEFAQAEQHLQRESDDATAALKRRGQTGAGANFRASILGLKPYELQNLSYQINDVVTGLASGQHASQILAQQGGQILQLFPKVGGAIISALANPAVLAFVATMGTAALAIKEAADQAERLRTATSDLGRRTNGGDYQAAGIASQQRELEHLGATAEQARAALNTFVDAGVPAASLSQFGRVASELARVLGIDLPQAATQLTTAFTGGYQAITELDNRLNFLTQAQREHIRQLFEEGHAQEAQTLALSIFTQKMDGAAASMRGPWSEASRSFSNAWHDLTEGFSNTAPIQTAISLLNDLANALGRFGRDIGGNDTLADLQRDLAQVNTQLAELQRALREHGGQGFDSELTDQVARLTAQRAALQVRINALTRSSAPANGPITQGDTPAARARADAIAAATSEERLQQLRDAGATRVLTAAERTERSQLAGAIAFRQEQDAAVGALKQRQAIEHEIAAIGRETTARQNAARAADRQAAQEQEQTIRSYLQRIGAAEGGSGRNRAGSSAEGIGQFTRGTFIGTYRQANPGTQYSDDQIANLRRDPTTAAQVLDIFTRQNAQFLLRLGQTVTGANLYLIHFLGQGTGRAVLRASGNTPVDQVINRVDPNSADVLRQNRSYLYNRDGTAKTRDQLLSFLGGRVGDATGASGSAAAAVAIQHNEAERDEQDQRRQAEFNESLRRSNEDHQRTIDSSQAQDGLHGVDLIDLRRVQAGTAAVQELDQRVREINQALPPGHALVTVTDAQINDVRRLAEATFDVQHAQEKLNAQRDDLQRPIDDLTEQRDLLRQQADLLDSMGDNRGAAQVRDQLDALTPRIQAAYDQLIAFYQALNPTERVRLGILDQDQLDNLIARLRVARDTAGELPRVLGQSGSTFLSAFSGAAATAFENFIKNVASGKNIFKSFAQGVKEFVASFALSLAEAILRTLAFIAALEVLSAITHIPVAALAQLAAASSSVASHHTGGIAGQGTGQRRTVDPIVFAGARRYHTGGIAGLAPDEVPAILREGEEVLTKNDPRHRNNIGAGGGGSAPGNGNINVYTLFKEEDLAERMLRTRAGERAVINIVRDNQEAFKAALT